MTDFTLVLFASRATTPGAEKNTAFSVEPTHITETNAGEFFKLDHAPILFKGGYRKSENFEYASCIVFDIDNSHSDNPDDWITPDKLACRLQSLGINYWIAASRNHLLSKGDKAPRPKFHVYLPLSVPLRNSDKFVHFCKWCIETFGADPKVKSKAQQIFGYGDNPNAFVDGWGDGRYVDKVLTDDDLADAVSPAKERKSKMPNEQPDRLHGEGGTDFDWFSGSGEWKKHLPDLTAKGWEFLEEKDGQLFFRTPDGDRDPGKQDGNIKDNVVYIFSRAPTPFEIEKGYSICQFFAGVLFGDTGKKGLAQFAERYLRNGQREPTVGVRAKDESIGVPMLDDFCAKLKRLMFQAEGGGLTQMEYIVQSVDELIRIAEAEQLDLAQKNGDFHAYNGRCWERILPEVFHAFLRNALVRFGVPCNLARFYQFQKKVRDQFRDVANFPFTPTDAVIRINLKSGTLEFRDGQEPVLVPFNKRHGIRYQLGYDFSPGADCSLFRKFLERCVPETANQQILLEYAGYIFVNELNFEKVLFMYGQGMNGKSVMIAVLKALFGEHNVTEYSLESISKKAEYRAKLADGILNICAESANSLNIDVFKKIASREPLECRSLYKDPIMLTDYSRQIFSTNTLPKITEATEGFFRRFLFVPFDQYITEEERNYRMNMVEYWEESGELPGILNMVIAGLQRLVQNGGFTKSASSDVVLEEYKLDSNSVHSFVQDEGYVPCTESKVKLKALYDVYRLYCSNNGLKAVSIKNLAHRLRNLGYVVERGAGNVSYVHCRGTEQ